MKRPSREGRVYNLLDIIVAIVVTLFFFLFIWIYFLLIPQGEGITNNDVIIFFQSLLTNLIASAALFLVSYVTLRLIQTSRSQYETELLAEKVSDDVSQKIANNVKLRAQLIGLEEKEIEDIESIVSSYRKIRGDMGNDYIKDVAKEMLSEFASNIRKMTQEELTTRESAQFSFLNYGMDKAREIRSIVISPPEYWKIGYGRIVSNALCNLSKDSNLKISRIWIMPEQQLVECWDLIKQEKQARIGIKVIHPHVLEFSSSVGYEFLIVDNGRRGRYAVKFYPAVKLHLERNEEFVFDEREVGDYEAVFYKLDSNNKAEDFDTYRQRNNLPAVDQDR